MVAALSRIVIVIMMMLVIWVMYYTGCDLPPKQRSNRIMSCVAVALVFSFFIAMYLLDSNNIIKLNWRILRLY